jgi:glutamate racemase
MDLYRILVEKELVNKSGAPVTHNFVATGAADKFSSLARRFLGPEVVSVSQKI